MKEEATNIEPKMKGSFLILKRNPLLLILFLFMIGTVPTLLYTSVGGGFVPTFIYFQWLPGGLIYVFVYSVILYFLARLIANFLMLMEPAARGASLVLLIVIMIYMTFQPIYGIGHTHIMWMDLYELLSSGRL